MEAVTSWDAVDNTTNIIEDDLFYMSLERDQLIETIYACVSIFGIPGNVLTLVAILTSPQMRAKPFNVLIVNQSLIDLSSCLCGVMVQYVKPTFDSTLSGQLTCQIWSSMYLFWVFSFSSSYNLTAIAVERYLAIANPLKYDEEKVFRRMPIVLVFVWLSGAVFLIPEAVTSHPISETECVLYYQISFAEKVFINAFYTTVDPIIPLLVMAYAYTNIALSLRKSSKASLTSSGKGRVNLHKAQIHIIQTAAFLSVLFFTCWTYLYVIQIGATFFGIPWYPQYHIAVALVIFNSTINPYVYCIRYDEFQNRIAEIFYIFKNMCCSSK